MFGGLVLVEVCDANLATDAALLRLEDEFPGVTMLVNDCMSHCELCARTPYALLDGQVVTAATPDDLFQQLRQGVSARLKDYDALI